MKENVLKIPEIFELYRELKYEKKFASLDMSEKLYMLQRVGEAYLSYKEAGKVLPLSSEFVLDNINERGHSRTIRVLKFADDMMLKLRTENFESKTREEIKMELKKKIFQV